MKLSKHIKGTFVMNVLLIITAMWADEPIAIAASVIIFVIISVTVEILDAIYEAKT